MTALSLLRDPFRVLRRYNRNASVLLGSNRDEFAMFMPSIVGASPDLTEAGFDAKLQNLSSMLRSRKALALTVTTKVSS